MKIVLLDSKVIKLTRTQPYFSNTDLQLDSQMGPYAKHKYSYQALEKALSFQVKCYSKIDQKFCKQLALQWKLCIKFHHFLTITDKIFCVSLPRASSFRIKSSLNGCNLKNREIFAAGTRAIIDWQLRVKEMFEFWRRGRYLSQKYQRCFFLFLTVVGTVNGDVSTSAGAAATGAAGGGAGGSAAGGGAAGGGAAAAGAAGGGAAVGGATGAAATGGAGGSSAAGGGAAGGSAAGGAAGGAAGTGGIKEGLLSGNYCITFHP